MRRLRNALIISFLIHCILILIVSRVPREAFQKTPGIVFQIIQPEREPYRQIISPKQNAEPQIETKSREETESLIKDPPIQPSVKNDAQTKYQQWKPEAFQEANKQHFLSLPSLKDNQTIDLLNPFSSKTSLPQDRIARDIQVKNLGTESSHFLYRNQHTYSEKEERYPPRFDFIPSEAQIQSLKTVYQQGQADQVKIYSSLQLNNPITAKQLDQSLNQLVKKGFLIRKKISPENKFTIALPLFSIPVEMSRKNRINPVYIYESNISKDKLMSYLQSIHTQLETEFKIEKKDSLVWKYKLKDIQTGIQALAY